MPDSSAGVLYVGHAAVPDLIAAYQTAVDRVDAVLDKVLRRGRVPQPWMEDPHTQGLLWSFNQWAVDGPRSALTALLEYQDRLVDIIVQLRAVQQRYADTEASTAARLGVL